jgi:predicted ATPase
MFTEVKVDGFRSLIGFQLRLRPGLNVLVGPNGTGKSNFISFLDFLSAFVERDLNSAIAVAQGAGSVFSKERFSKDEASLTFDIHGTWKYNPNEDHYLARIAEEKSSSGMYQYHCQLNYSRSIPAVYIAHERLHVTGDQDLDSRLEFERETMREDRAFVTRIKINGGSGALRSELFKYARRTKEQEPEQVLADRVSHERSLVPYLGGETAALASVASDLTSYKSVNIDPAIARRPSPVGSFTRIAPTGEGLAGALYQLKSGNFIPNMSRLYRYWGGVAAERVPSFESILSWCREVNPSIAQVDVELDFMEAQLRPSMRFLFGNRDEIISFTRISDGTVKWLTLVTILLAEPSLNIIEEPENFLHPFMQEAFVTLCRKVIEEDSRRTILVSTHSPSVLDCCGPTEVTMFELNEGQSRATRVANWQELTAKIQRSRFGLGYYYKTGALYGENSGSG